VDTPELIGAAGVFLLLVAFLLNLLGILGSDRLPYQGLNFVGAAVSCYASVLIGFRPFVVLEAVWSLVALIAIIRSLRTSTRREKIAAR
jgi:hypothetical protein